MSTIKKLQFVQYNFSILTNILSSQFVYTDFDMLPRLKKLSVSIQVKGSKKTHFWYLSLLTNQKPYVEKFHPSWKTRAQKTHFASLKTKSMWWKLNIRKKFLLSFLQDVLFDLFYTQYNLERRILRLEASAIRILLPSASLTSKTLRLQSKKTYFIRIPLTFKFFWVNVSLFQKIFILRQWKIIKQPHIKLLDEEWTY